MRTITASSQTKRSPSRSSGRLARPALERRLDEAFAKRLTTLTADAGFGKTTLLSGWATDVECSWYTVTARATDLSSFAGGVARAIQSRVPQLAEVPVAAGLSGGTEHDELLHAEAFAGALCDALDDCLVPRRRSRARRRARAGLAAVRSLPRELLPAGAGDIASRARVASRAAVRGRPPARPGTGARAVCRRPRLRLVGDRGAARSTPGPRRRRACRRSASADGRLARARPACGRHPGGCSPLGTRRRVRTASRRAVPQCSPTWRARSSNGSPRMFRTSCERQRCSIASRPSSARHSASSAPRKRLPGSHGADSSFSRRTTTSLSTL